jgi:hypothetical protein
MVIGKTDDMGNMILARVPEPASCAFLYDQGFELCYGPQDADTSSSSGNDRRRGRQRLRVRLRRRLAGLTSATTVCR